jgi:tRNA-dihydrouridine synthase B
MFDKTGVDGIMIGRGSLGNPWIFREIKYFLETGKKLEKPTIQERLNVMKKHIELAVADKGENVATHELRKHISWYTKNLKNSSEFRSKVNSVENSDELLKIVNEYFNQL